jgi:hypothetical protein
MTKPSQAQVREINRSLLATVRADWRFPEDRTLRAATLEPLTYRERYYSTSEDDGEDDSTTDTEEEESEGDETEEASWSSPETELEINPLDEEGARKGKGKKKRKFSCPDDVAAYLNRKIESRKRRKMRALADEMSWNKGLCFFLRRRNAWTGALTQEEVKAKEDAKSNKSKEEDEADDESLSSGKQSKDHDESTSSASDTDSGIAVSPSQYPLTTTITPTNSSPFDPPEDPASLVNVLVPISIPFLPANHPVRSSIMARTHSELYEKIVRDSRTPAVPLNLAHMMRVIVQGWKDEGNWPPKSAMAEASIAGKKKGKAAQVKAVTEQKGVGLFVGHKHLQRGVESVRRALRLSGSAPPAGD